MTEILKTLFEAPLSTILVVSGLASLLVGILGTIGKWVALSKTQRILVASIGGTALVVGIALAISSAPWTGPWKPGPT